MAATKRTPITKMKMKCAEREARTKLNEAPQATSTTLARPRSLMAVSCAFFMSFTGFAAESQDAWKKTNYRSKIKTIAHKTKLSALSNNRVLKHSKPDFAPRLQKMNTHIYSCDIPSGAGLNHGLPSLSL
jgi:hypothetical protein